MFRVKTLTVVLIALTFAALPWMTRQTMPAMAAGGFTIFQLGDGPQHGVAGEVCPNSNPHPFSSTPPCTNEQTEPQIRANNAGEFYGASENGVPAGTEAYRSLNNPQSYMHLASPNEASVFVPGGPGTIGPGGGDVDVAVSPQRNANGIYNTYVASLSLANVTVSTSTDRGTTWKANPVAAQVPGDDREWVAADMASKVCVSYRDLAAAGIHVNCSYDAGNTFTQPGEAIDTNHEYLATNFEIGNLVIDAKSHFVYQTFSSIDQQDLVNPTNLLCTNLVGQPCMNHVVYMAVSRDGGKTFTDYVVHDGPPTVSYGHQFVNVSVDRAGNVYSVYSDNHNVYYSYSTDHGQTWTGPFQINTGTGGQQTALMPWSTAGSNGRIAVVFYGANFYDGVHPPDNYPCNDPTHCAPVPDPNGPGTAAWNVFYSENLSATTNGHGFSTPVQVTGVPVHYGGVCEGGVGCTGDRGHNRDLYDDFGVAVSPVTNTASIIFDSDRSFEYGQASRLANGSSQSTLCTQADDNTRNCGHTDIATGQSHIFANAPGGNTGGGSGGTGTGGNDGQCNRTAQSAQAEQDLMTSLNAHRLAAGLPALNMANNTQSEAARDHACDNASTGKSTDQDSEGNTHDTRMHGAGETFATSNENNSSAVPTSATTAATLLDNNLMADPAAKLNVLNPAVTSVGIGAVDVNGVIWVTEDFSG